MEEATMPGTQLRSRAIAVLALVLLVLTLGGGAEAKKKPPQSYLNPSAVDTIE
jgi:hypothetical protein